MELHAVSEIPYSIVFFLTNLSIQAYYEVVRKRFTVLRRTNTQPRESAVKRGGNHMYPESDCEQMCCHMDTPATLQTSPVSSMQGNMVVVGGKPELKADMLVRSCSP